jgi:hypothetical protein
MHLKVLKIWRLHFNAMWKTSIKDKLVLRFSSAIFGHALHKTPKPFLGNCCHSCKIAVLNSSIFWHFGLRWLIFRPIKSHTCSIGTGYMIIWGGLFAHGDGSTGLMKVVFCYALPTVVQGLGANETLHFRKTTFWAQLLLGEWLTLKWSTTLLWLKPPLCMPTACHLSGMVNFRRTIPNQ